MEKHVENKAECWRKHRCVHFEKYEDNLDDAEFETDAKQIKAEQSVGKHVKKQRGMLRKNRCEHFEECEECDDDAMKCKHTESNNNTAEFVNIVEEEYEESEKQYEQR